ncbi:MAG: DUF3857 domain-containing protein [Bacteroidales bacterium]|nr:DUF3857 domain-containing protein [Bacteroidales bacterium]
MKKILLSVVIFSFFYLQSTVARAQQPDAVYKLLKQEWTVNADGTSDYHYRHEVQILRNRALVAYADKGETFVVYNPDIEELTVNEVYTVRADGSRVEMPQNAYIYQLPSNCADCGRFNHFRELAMVHTGMEIGCVIVVDYTIHRNYNLISNTIELVRDCPIDRLEVNVTVPEGQELNVQLNNPEVIKFGPSVKQTQTSYSLTAAAVPQSFVDSYLPDRSQLYPTLRFYNGVPEFIPAFDNAGLKEAMDVVGRIQSGDTPKENIGIIRDYVVDNIHLNDIPAEKLGYVHSTAAEVWRTGCGTATDKAVLLAAMLNQWGYKARVNGDNSDEVGVMIDTLEYRLDVRRKAPMEIYGEAKDEVDTQDVKLTVEPELKELTDGFYLLPLSPMAGSPKVDAAGLSTTRVAPLQTSACCLSSDITYMLPKGMKMVGNAVSEKMAFEGVGSVELSVKQSGKKLRIVRKLNVEKSIVTAENYDSFRKLMVLWQSIDSILLTNNK